MPSASFRFGPAGKHECRMEFGRLGNEQYLVDGNLVYEIQSLQFNGMREFSANGHDIRIEVKAGIAGTVVRVLVDGQVVNEDAWAEHTRILRFLHSRRGYMLFATLLFVTFLASLIVSFNYHRNRPRTLKANNINHRGD